MNWMLKDRTHMNISLSEDLPVSLQSIIRLKCLIHHIFLDYSWFWLTRTYLYCSQCLWCLCCHCDHSLILCSLFWLTISGRQPGQNLDTWTGLLWGEHISGCVLFYVLFFYFRYCFQLPRCPCSTCDWSRCAHALRQASWGKLFTTAT